MTPNNWALCPQCINNARKEEYELKQKIKESYGVISKDDYLKLVDKSKNTIGLKQTLREDYEIGIYEDRFFIYYHGRCSVCGFSKKYEVNEPSVEKDPK